MDWGTVLAVLVAMAIFLAALILIGGTAGFLMMRKMFRKGAEGGGCPMPGCPFGKAMEEHLGEAEEEPVTEEPVEEAEREKVAV